MTTPLLEIEDLYAGVDGKDIIKGFNLTINAGEIHAIMGPNGTGKSTLSAVIMGHPKYVVTEGTIELNGENILEMSVDERSRKGLFLAMQYPSEITGVTNSDFIKTAMQARLEEGQRVSLFKFIKALEGATAELKMNPDLPHRYVNVGFSGGEKKRNEIVQMSMLKPELSMLDEIDSGLDVDALKIVANAIVDLQKQNEMSLIVVSHYARFYQLLRPTHAHVLVDGKIVVSGDATLVDRIDSDGYDWIEKEYGVQVKEEKQAKKQVVSLGSCAAQVKKGA